MENNLKLCVNCGHENAPNLSYCYNCGDYLKHPLTVMSSPNKGETATGEGETKLDRETAKRILVNFRQPVGTYRLAGVLAGMEKYLQFHVCQLCGHNSDPLKKFTLYDESIQTASSDHTIPLDTTPLKGIEAGKSLEECKDEVAKIEGFINWEYVEAKHLKGIIPIKDLLFLTDNVALLYASQRHGWISVEEGLPNEKHKIQSEIYVIALIDQVPEWVYFKELDNTFWIPFIGEQVYPKYWLDVVLPQPPSK